MPVTYEIIKDKHGLMGIHCKICELTSWNQYDVINAYCGKCCTFHNEVTSEDYNP